jgi:hypothetical protein
VSSQTRRRGTSAAARICRALAIVTGALAPALASAQAGAEGVCQAGRIGIVFVDNHSIFDPADPDLDDRFDWAYRAANALHTRTRAEFIQRELLVRPGDCYDPWLVEETERLLRNYDFLGRVNVEAERIADGSWTLTVDTRDEWSTEVDVRLASGDKGFGIEGVRITESNLLGTGRELGLFYFQRDATRDYGASYYTPQLAGTRWDMRAEGGRTRAGTFVNGTVAYPFVGEVSRWSGRAFFSRNDQFFDYLTADDAGLAAHRTLVPTREKYFEFSAVRRIGDQGRVGMLGAGVSFQELAYPGDPQRAVQGDYDQLEPGDSATIRAVAPHLHPLNSIHAFLLLGHRNIWWVKRTGLDSMRGEEDVRLGAEVGLALGRSLPSLENDDDLVTTLSLYTAVEAGDALFVASARGDVRRNLAAAISEPEWEDFYGEAELLAYLRPTGWKRHTFLLRAAGLGAWHTRTPFQLTLGGLRAVRGLHPSRFPGGRRAVVSLEDRFFIGWPLPDVLDLGLTVFADAGRVWAGDVPYGADSGLHGSVGTGIRASFPAGSRSTFRLDFAWPLGHDAGFSDARVTFAFSEILGLARRGGATQLVRSRPDGPATTLFQFQERR